ncbi:MAG: hypothetical protein LIP01_04960 [Tannerellaceae bacterium]|nr:hypothetical protein [Tannerellaceae bacterium]
MITEDIISNTYLQRVINRDANRIYYTQADVIRHKFPDERSGRLANFLVTRPFTSSGSPGRQTFHFRIFTYLRFLDIRHSAQKLALYNRVVWGILYNETLPDLRYGYTKDIQDSIRHELEQTVKP